MIRLPSLLTLIPLAVLLGSSSMHRATPRGEAHPVTMHLESFVENSIVVVHLSSVPRGLRMADNSIAIDSITVRTPADVRVSAEVKRLELRSEGNLAVRVSFTEGASTSERGMRAWGRRLLFVRVDGDLQQRAELMPAQP